MRQRVWCTPGLPVRLGSWTSPRTSNSPPRCAIRATTTPSWRAWPTLATWSGDACLSHTSAALLHGLPYFDDTLERVQVIRPRSAGGRRGRLVHVHPAPLPPEDVVDLAGLRVTSLARTTVDCARSLAYARAVAMGDVALRLGLERDELLAILNRPGSRHGDPQARRVAAFVDGRAESVGESFSRVTLARLGLAPSDLQLDVADDLGQLVARSDFAWKEQRTLGEFDGRIKYSRLLRPGQTAGDVVFAEKRREDLLRDLGWEIVRWVWEDLHHPERIAERLRRAFARGSRRVG